MSNKPDPDAEAVIAIGNQIYEALKAHGIAVPADFSGYNLAQQILESPAGVQLSKGQRAYFTEMARRSEDRLDSILSNNKTQEEVMGHLVNSIDRIMATCFIGLLVIGGMVLFL